jgi:membrane protein YqaA with SNARE-associated domain
VNQVLRILVVVAMVGISVAIFLFRDQMASLAALGYPGVFLVSLLGNATIILPAPYLLIVFAMGSSLSPPLVALAAATGAALGEMTGYAAGYGGRAVIPAGRTYERLKGWMERRGGITVFLLAAITNPFADVGGIIAGTLRYPVRSYLFYSWLGKMVKMLVIAYAGARSLTWIEQLIE